MGKLHKSDFGTSWWVYPVGKCVINSAQFALHDSLSKSIRMEEASCQNILKLLFGVTLPFQKHLCESGQLVFGSWRWNISVHIVDEQWNYKLHVNTKTSDLEQTFPHPFHTWENYERNSLQWFLLHFISYNTNHILKCSFLTVTTCHCQLSRSKILCQYATFQEKWHLLSSLALPSH